MKIALAVLALVGCVVAGYFPPWCYSCRVRYENSCKENNDVDDEVATRSASNRQDLEVYCTNGNGGVVTVDGIDGEQYWGASYAGRYYVNSDKSCDAMKAMDCGSGAAADDAAADTNNADDDAAADTNNADDDISVATTAASSYDFSEHYNSGMWCSTSYARHYMNKFASDYHSLPDGLDIIGNESCASCPVTSLKVMINGEQTGTFQCGQELPTCCSYPKLSRVSTFYEYLHEL